MKKLAIRTSDEWLQWVVGLADHCHTTTATATEQALIRFAEGVGYHAPPPPRTARFGRRDPKKPTVERQIAAERADHHRP